MKTEESRSNPVPDRIRDVAILIPAWQPDETLMTLVMDLHILGVSTIVVVDDGSAGDACRVLDELKPLPYVTVLRHVVNMGKGRALKSGLNHVLVHNQGLIGVVTADADGQHTAKDIVRVGLALVDAEDRIVLGCRTFKGDVPTRSRFGNTLTRYVFWMLTGRKIGDTQSGLRGFPVGLISDLLTLQGERYEYEMNVLAHVCRIGSSPIELPIATVYIEQNRSSHFDPVRDSMRIYFVLLRFYASSLVAAGIDFAGFTLTFSVTKSILMATLVGRLSSLANFALNKRYVFQSGAPVRVSLWRYYVLAAALVAMSFGAIRGLSLYWGWNVLLAKVLTDTVLSLASFALQRTFVFPLKDER